MISQSADGERFLLQGCLQCTAISNCPGVCACVHVRVCVYDPVLHLSNLPYVLHHRAVREERGEPARHMVIACARAGLRYACTVQCKNERGCK